MREVFFLIDSGQNVLWSDASESPVRLPDSRARWEAIWSRRDHIAEIVHSHPVGPLAFSREDETTMAALVSAFGRDLTFSVVAPDGIVRRRAELPVEGPLRPPVDEILRGPEPWWAALLRMASGMTRDRRPSAVAEPMTRKEDIQ